MRRASWPDTSLGCPRRGEQYAQVVTSGFVIELAHGDEVYTYHASPDRAVLCGKPAATDAGNLNRFVASGKIGHGGGDATDGPRDRATD